MDLGRLIQSTRKGHGLTQAQLSREAGVSLATLQNIEAGVANPSLATLAKVMAPLGLDWDIGAANPDWSSLARHGLPLFMPGAGEAAPTAADLVRLIRSTASYLSKCRPSDVPSREYESFQALLLALQTAFPDRWDAWFTRSPLISGLLPERPTGRLIKLRRIARTHLASYL